MSIISERITLLVKRYEENTITRAEYEELLTYLQHPEFEDAFSQIMVSEWERPPFEYSSSEDVELLQPWYKRRTNWVGIAASIALIVGFFVVRLNQQTHDELVFSTAYGERRHIILPDSSDVYLNANTTLVWDASWRKHQKRSAKIRGEAYFKVRKYEGMAFEVATGDVKVHVLGTSFNVKARRGVTDVYLESGKVDIALEDIKKETFTMQPGNAVQYYKNAPGLILERTSSLERSAAWIDGMLQFQNVALEHVLLQLEELYGKRFEVANKDLLQKRIDIALPYGDWNLLRNALELVMNITITETDELVRIQ